MLLVGTALTMADVAVAAAAQNPHLELHAMSRHGLLPAVQAGTGSHSPDAVPDFRACVAQGRSGARCLVRAFRALARDLQRRGGDWLDAVNAARVAAPGLWQRMPPPSATAFYAICASTGMCIATACRRRPAQQLARLRQAGRLRIHAGQLRAIEDAGGALRVCWRPRGATALRELTVDRVIDCSRYRGTARANP